MGFSVRIAPGIRVRASSRGVRTSIGPRVARVHVGGGRTGFSTGVGPVGYYTSVGGSRPRRPARTGTVTAQRQLAAASRANEKLETARALNDALQKVLELHQEAFEPARPPQAPAPPPVDVGAIRAQRVREAKAATSFFDRAGRKAALAEAEQRATAEAAQLAATYDAERQRWQWELDRQWNALLSNEPDEVLAALADAFEDNEAPAAAVGLAGDEVTLVVVVPSISVLPERRPVLTSAGNVSLKKLTKTETNALYLAMVCGYVLVTVKEAFAVAPALRSTKVVTVRARPQDAYGKVGTDVLMATTFARERLKGIQWQQADAVRVTEDASSEWVRRQRGAAKELQPLDLAAEPDLAKIVAAVDFEELF